MGEQGKGGGGSNFNRMNLIGLFNLLKLSAMVVRPLSHRDVGLESQYKKSSSQAIMACVLEQDTL